MKHTLLITTALMLVFGFSNVNGQTYTGLEFYESGEPKSIKTYKVSKDKIELVKESMWRENGQKWNEGTYKDNKLDGEYTSWYPNGQKRKEGTYKDGEKYRKWTEWYSNGQKWNEGTYKDGKEDGKWKFWYENGKSGEATFKDGEFITAECWDEDGNEMDCDELE